MTKPRSFLPLLFTILAYTLPLQAIPYVTDIENDSFTVVTYNVQTDDLLKNEQQTEKFLRYNAQGVMALMDTRPDVVNLQEVPTGGIQWLEKNFGNDYKVVYAPRRMAYSQKQKNDNAVILYRKARFESLEKENHNPSIKTKYFSDDSGHLFLMTAVKDRHTHRQISFINTHIKGGNSREKGEKQVAEMISLLQQYNFAVVAGDFNGTVTDDRLIEFAVYGFIHDPVAEATEPSKNSKVDHILFKGSGRSRFIAEMCRVNTGIKGSDHYPLACRVYLE